MSQFFDVVIVGAGFGGLIAAKTLAEKGISVAVLDRKKMAGQGMHTTGILVKRATQLLEIPEPLVKKVNKVHLYSPSFQKIRLQTPDYFFLTTDTPGLMKHLSDEAEKAGAVVRYGAAFETAEKNAERITLPEHNISCRFLIGADGPKSRVAELFRLGQNKAYLLGVEAEYASLPMEDGFHCFLSQKHAAGYIGWAIPGVGMTQVGLATRLPVKPDIDAFTQHIEPHISTKNAEVIGRRGGLIPVGGRVWPFYNDNVILLGDAAGIVSPLTAGGIHTALFYGKLLADLLAAHIHGKGAHPGKLLEKRYPRFIKKRLMRTAFEYTAPDWLLDVVIGNPLFKKLAADVFFTDGNYLLPREQEHQPDHSSHGQSGL